MNTDIDDKIPSAPSADEATGRNEGNAEHAGCEIGGPPLFDKSVCGSHDGSKKSCNHTHEPTNIDIIQLAVSGLTLFFVGFYTFLTGIVVVDGRKSSIEANRPWIGFEAISPTPQILRPDGTDIAIYLVNAGKSPAFITSNKIGTGVLDAIKADQEYIFNRDKRDINSKSVSVPGGRFSMRTGNVAFSVDEWNDICAGRRYYFVYGEIIYTDVSRTPTYYTRFCYMYRPQERDYVACEKYNDAK